MLSETTKLSLDKTAQSDAQFVDEFLESMKTLDEKYERQKQNVNLKNDQSLIEFQNKFWLKSIASLDDSINKLEQNGRKEKSDEIDQILLDYHILAELHTRKIINQQWPISDSESRKQTILIAFVELEQLHDVILTELKGTSKTISIANLTYDESGEKSGTCSASYDGDDNKNKNNN